MKHNKRISKYHIVEGIPSKVSTEVNNLLAEGWKLHGTLHKIKIAPDNIEIVIQAMVLLT